MRHTHHKTPYYRSKGRLLLLGIVICGVLIALAVQRALYLSAPPVAEKDCPPDVRAQDTDSVITEAMVQESKLTWLQKGGTINDASCLDRTHIYGIVDIRSDDDVKNALAFARTHKLKVSMAGVRHSQGGQAFAHNALVLDMRNFKHMTLNDNQTITVQPGATWHDIQNVLHPRYAVKAMQSTDIFTVGGSISVNAHGMDHQAGSVADTLRSIKVMRADGSVVTASKTQNAELFHHVVGGYGLFGVVLEATLDIEPNVIYESKRHIIKTADFPALWQSIEADKDIGLFYTHLSTSPLSLLDEAVVYTYHKTNRDPLTAPPLHEVSSVRLRRLTINFAKLGDIPQMLKWWSEKKLEPLMESCEISRNDAQKSGEGCLVARNEPMHDSVPYLKDSIPSQTDILHEYFVPRANLLPFIADMKQIFKEHDAHVLNVSIRVIKQEDMALNYAPNDAFSVVLYINQPATPEGTARMKALTKALIHASHAHGGTFFLPYQLHYTKDDLAASYPGVQNFFAYKRVVDPNELFTNTWYETYGKRS